MPKFFLNLIIAFNVAYIVTCFTIHWHFPHASFFLNYHDLIQYTTTLYYDDSGTVYLNSGIDVVAYASTAWLVSFCIGLELLRQKSRFGQVMANMQTTKPEINMISKNKFFLNSAQKLNSIDFTRIFSSWHGDIAALPGSESLLLIEKYKLAKSKIIAINDIQAILNNKKLDNKILIILDNLACLGNLHELDSECIFIEEKNFALYLILIDNEIANLYYLEQPIIIIDLSTRRMFYPLLKGALQ